MRMLKNIGKLVAERRRKTEANKEDLKQRLCAVSPFDLASVLDDRYRDAVDEVVDSVKYIDVEFELEMR